MNMYQHSAARRDVRRDLEWFYTNLKDQIEDRELETKNVTLEFFWDNSQVQRAVLGALDFFDPDFKVSKFNDPQTLVACLAAQGWLGTIKMLEPHQAEFARALRKNFVREETWLTQEQRKTFFGAIALPNGEELSLSKLGQLDEKEQKRLIADYADEAERLFKAVQSAGGPWRNRLSTMYLGNVLELSPSRSTEEYESIFGSENFRKIREELDQRRSSRSDNNLADAVCLCLLQRQLQAFQNESSRIMPRFYETTPTFRSALKETGLQSTVSYLDLHNEEKTVLRESDYFLFRAAFTVRDDRVNSKLANLELATLKSISEQIGSILKSSKPLRTEEVAEIYAGEYPITEIIDDLKKLWVLERIWLPYLAEGDLGRLNKDERARLEGFKPDPDLTRIVESSVTGMTLALNKNVSAYERFREEYRKLNRYITALPKDYEAAAGGSERIYLVSGLVRFGIPDKYTNEIELLLGPILLKDGDISRDEAAAKLAKTCVAAKFERKVEDRTVAYALMWTLGLHLAILEVPLMPSEVRWNIAIYAAACLQLKKVSEARRWIRDLEERMPADLSHPEAGPIATALSYLYFHLWREEGGRVAWRPDRPASNNRTASELRELVDLCLRYADIAYETELEEAPGRLYVLNILLFYLTEAGTDQQFQRTLALANALMVYGNDSTMWQYRFDDTLARYFHRRSQLVRDPDIRQRLWESHLRYLKAAVDHNPGNPDVTLYAGITSNVEGGHESVRVDDGPRE